MPGPLSCLLDWRPPSPGGLVSLSSKRHPQCHSQVTVSVTVNVHGGFFASVAQPQKGPQQAHPAPTILVIKLVCIKVIKLVCLVVQSVMVLFRIFKTLSIPNRKSWRDEILREFVTCHVSHFTCQVSCVICQVSHVTCHVSNSPFSVFFTKWWS